MKTVQRLVTIAARRPLLLCPGPVQLSRKARRAAAQTWLSHRDEPFSEVMSRIDSKLRAMVNANDDFVSLLITGSGTVANETVISTLGRAGKMLIISNGEFGERLVGLAKIHAVKHDELAFGWQKKFSLKKIEEALKSGEYASVACVHHETSTGMLNPIKSVAGLAKKYGVMCMVDTVSSLAAEHIDVSWGIDLMTSSSGKALSAMPGVGLVVARREVVERLDDGKAKNHYLNLHNYYNFKNRYNQTPNTPAVHVFATIAASLDHDKPGRTIRETVAKRAAYCRAQFDRHGIKYSHFGNDMTSSVVTNVELPEGLDADDIAEPMKNSYGVVLYNGKGPLENKIVQMGHIGHMTDVRYRLAVKTFCEVYCTLQTQSNKAFGEQEVYVTETPPLV